MALFLSNAALAPLLEIRPIIDQLDQAYRRFAGGDGVTTPRFDLQSSPNTAGETYQLGLTAGVDEQYAAVRIKSDMTFWQKEGGRVTKGKYCRQPGEYMGLILLFSSRNGELLAIMQDGLLQHLRVGADSAIGARYLAREGASILGILGSGGMARAHIDTLCEVLPIERVRIYSPTAVNREVLADYARSKGLQADAVASPADCAAGADILSACTNAIGPVIDQSLLAPGIHVTSIGGTLDDTASKLIDIGLRLGNATTPSELPDLNFTDECMSYTPTEGKSSSGGTKRFANLAKEQQILLTDLLANPARGRTNARQITFSERGNIHGIQFTAVAAAVYEQALAQKVGQTVDPGFLQNIRN